MADERAHHASDITDTFEAKLAALRAPTSQTAHLGDGLEERVRQRGAQIADSAGLGPRRRAEIFRVIATPWARLQAGTARGGGSWRSSGFARRVRRAMPSR